MKSIVAGFITFLLSQSSLAHVAAQDGYCVVVSQATQDTSDWNRVVEALVAKHRALVHRLGDANTNDGDKSGSWSGSHWNRPKTLPMRPVEFFDFCKCLTR